MATFLECLRIFLKLVEKTVEIFIFDYELNFSYLKKNIFLDIIAYFVCLRFATLKVIFVSCGSGDAGPATLLCAKVRRLQEVPA